MVGAGSTIRAWPGGVKGQTLASLSRDGLETGGAGGDRTLAWPFQVPAILRRLVGDAPVRQRDRERPRQHRRVRIGRVIGEAFAVVVKDEALLDARLVADELAGPPKV